MYAPGAAVSSLVQSIAYNQHKMFPCSVFLDGEYGLYDLAIGVPVVLGKKGVEKIVDINLNAEENDMLIKSAKSVKKTNELLSEMKIF